MGASSFSPSPITTTPSIATVSASIRRAPTAAPSAPSLSPRPIQRAQASAAYSVVRTSSMARLRSGFGAASMRRTLYDARWLASGLVNGLAQVAGHQQPERSEQAHEPAHAEAHLDAGLRFAQDDPVAEDQAHGRDAHDHGHLAGLPGQLVPARDDPGEDERREAGSHQQEVERREDLPRVRRVAGLHRAVARGVVPANQPP